MKRPKELVNPFLDSLEKVIEKHGVDVKAVDLIKHIPSLTQRVTTREYLLNIDPYPVNAYISILVNNSISPEAPFSDLHEGHQMGILVTFANLVSYLNLTEYQLVNELLPLVQEIVAERLEAVKRFSTILEARKEKEKGKLLN